MSNQILNKPEIVEAIAQRIEGTKSDGDRLFEAVFGEHGVLSESLKSGDTVRVSGLGIFSTKLRKARKARNPKTGASVTVSAKTVPVFRFSPSFKKAF